MNDSLKHELKIQMLALGSYKELKNKLLVIKVGTEDWPATQDDLTDVQEALSDLTKGAKDSMGVLVTHHAVNVEIHPLRLEPGETRVVKVGSKDRPATREDIEDMTKNLKTLGLEMGDTKVENAGEEPGDELV